jgi:hypothetical protein
MGRPPLDRGRGLATDGGAPTEEADEPEVTAEWLEGRYFCYPIECGVCGDQLAGPEENGVIGRGDALAIDADGHAVCQHHTDEIRFVAAGVYAHGGGTPCETNRSFRPEDVVTVRATNDEDDRLATDGRKTVTGYYDDELRTVTGHLVLPANVYDDGTFRVKYECQDCGLLSNTVTGFDQRACESESGEEDYVAYWAAQVRAFLDSHDYEAISETARYNADDVVLALPRDSDLRRRRNREVLVTELETAGFDVLDAEEDVILVDAPEDNRLSDAFDSDWTDNEEVDTK